MNPINKKALMLTNTTEQDFLDYCILTKLSKVNPQTRTQYFSKILTNKIVKDKDNKIKVLK